MSKPRFKWEHVYKDTPNGWKIIVRKQIVQDGFRVQIYRFKGPRNEWWFSVEEQDKETKKWYSTITEDGPFKDISTAVTMAEEFLLLSIKAYSGMCGIVLPPF